MSRKLRFGIVGAGDFAAVCHIPGLLAHPAAEVVAICARRRESAAALAARFAIPHVCADAAELCAREDLDGVVVATPNAAHREQALLAFAAGKHVFCEKPLGLSTAESADMLAAAEASQRIHQVAFTYRYLHGVAELRRRVLAGDVGEPYYLRIHHEFWDGMKAGSPIGWRHLLAPAGGGVLFDSGSHFFDLARFVLGPIAAVSATVQHLPRQGALPDGSRHPVETDDLAMASFDFAGTPAGTGWAPGRGAWHASRISPSRSENSVVVVGRDGALEAQISRGRVDGLRRAAAGSRDWQAIELPAEASAGGNHALFRMMASFVDACRLGSPAELDATFADGHAVQRLIEAAAASAAASPVALTPPA